MSHESTARGLFGGFEAYRTPSEADYRRLFTTGMIALDANVLLNLYRSSKRTRDDLLTTLEHLQERLWIPHQALVEFWRNRESESILNHHSLRAAEAKRTLNQRRQGALDTLNRWAKDVHVPVERIETHREALDNTFREAMEMIDRQASDDSITQAGDTNSDPILLRLEAILDNRVGDPLSAEKYAEALTEARRRAEQKEPPGYEDYKEKVDEQAAGDYLVWEQTLRAAQEKSCEVLLITGDTKEDWWSRRTPVAPARPRLELVDELKRRSGQRLFMLTPSGLPRVAEEILEISVDVSSVVDLKRLEHEKEGAWRWIYDPDAEHVVRDIPAEVVAQVENFANHLTEIGDEVARDGGPGIRTFPLPDAVVRVLVIEKKRTIVVVHVMHMPGFEG